ncbi:unnamed protein product [Trypanosoma congolense IL3000]|uniref:WGS project CAEQ00000000 data, annotated contig 1422 n=1 Tax=Trypanosoma congolense (strain IL3000) TaxID=1068625 RepID=F9W650_TRYCI|nr:unnamed protein product [Trypanosoma congolense IL3000]
MRTGRALQLLLHATIIFLGLVECAVAHVKRNRRVETVAGAYGLTGMVDGVPPDSRLSSPMAICRGRTADEILVGTASGLRTYSRSSGELGTLFTSSVKVVGGSTGGSAYGNPRSCVHRGIDNSSVIYFVDGQKDVKYYKNNEVLSKDTVANASLTAMTIFGGSLYMTDQINKALVTCKLSADGAPHDCLSKKKLNDTCGFNTFTGITSTAKGIFIAGQGSTTPGNICWIGLDDTTVTKLGQGEYVDVSSTSSGDLYAVSKTQIFHLEPAGSAPQLKTVAGVKGTPCLPTPDGEDIRFCELNKILAIADHELYVTSERSHLLRAVILPPVRVQAVFSGRPVPVGYPEGDTLDWIVENLVKDVNEALQTTESLIDPSTVYVDPDTWTTRFVALVQQSDFDDAATERALGEGNYTYITAALDEYYNETDQAVYMDSVMVPYCSEAALDAIRRKIAEEARRVLDFPLIYADMPVELEGSGAENVTMVKLLMPASFNNETVSELLEAADLTGFAHSAIKEMRGGETRVSVVLPNPPFNFSGVTPDVDQDIRWYVHGNVMKQLDICEKLNAKGAAPAPEPVEDSNESGGGVVYTGEFCQSSITNRTETQNLKPPYDQKNTYEIFLPNKYDFNASWCVDIVDWRELNDWLSNVTVGSHIEDASWCGQGCIIALAVVGALLTTGLVVVAVVLTSKRRRLAAVVAPPRPKFVSATEDEED